MNLDAVLADQPLTGGSRSDEGNRICGCVGAVYGNGPRVRKNASSNSSAIHRQRIAVAQ
jgi:hypothetical protein